MQFPADLSYGPDTRIVLIGTTICPQDMEGLPPLPQVEHNITYLARLFSDPDIIGLDPESVTKILDYEEASAITNAVRACAKQASDTLVVYYAGHGLSGDTATPLYLAAKNTTSEDKAFNAVRVTDLKNAIASSPAPKRILVLDCCYSGAALDRTMSTSDVASDAIDIAGTFGIAAVPGDYKALAGERLTRFTETLVKVLEHGIKDEIPVLTLERVFSEVRDQVSREAQLPLPQKQNWNNGGLFRFAKNRYLQRSGDERIYEALDGLRQTVSQSGARLEAIETRLNTLEASRAPSQKQAEEDLFAQTLSNLIRRPNWRLVHVSRMQYAAWPVEAKLLVQEYRDAHVASIIFCGLALGTVGLSWLLVFLTAEGGIEAISTFVLGLAGIYGASTAPARSSSLGPLLLILVTVVSGVGSLVALTGHREPIGGLFLKKARMNEEGVSLGGSSDALLNNEAFVRIANTTVSWLRLFSVPVITKYLWIGRSLFWIALFICLWIMFLEITSYYGMRSS